MDNLLNHIPEHLRNKYKDQFPFPVISLAKDLGLKIFESNDFTENEAGAIKKEGENYVIYLNTSDPATRKRFTIAHEIGHFLLHRHDLDNDREFVDNAKQPILNRSTHIALSAEEKEQEIKANDFAAQLLMPEDEFKKVFNKSKLIEEVADAFFVSPAAATIRAKEVLGYVII